MQNKIDKKQNCAIKFTIGYFNTITNTFTTLKIWLIKNQPKTNIYPKNKPLLAHPLLAQHNKTDVAILEFVNFDKFF